MVEIGDRSGLICQLVLLMFAVVGLAFVVRSGCLSSQDF